MNRAERRRQQRAGIKVQKEPTLNLKISDFDHLERFYRDMMKEHIRMRKFYEMDDTYPERYKLKELCGVDVEALNNEFKEVIQNV